MIISIMENFSSSTKSVLNEQYSDVVFPIPDLGIIDECFSRDGRNLHRFLQIPSNWAITEMILIAHLVN